MFLVTDEELDFPLAFGHSVHKEAGLVELQMATLIRPHDSHCFHVDPKATEEFKRAMGALVGCYQKKFPQATIFLDEVCKRENRQPAFEL